jgi:DNA (cytosine-5)-methyltransferase 1
MSNFTHIGLFEGIGGFSLAARWMGWETIAWCEWNPFGQKVLKHHFPKATGHGDITKTDFTIYRGKCDILTGGFPCQDLSIANRYNGGGKGLEGARSGLWKEYARAIREIRPKFIVFENSPMLVVSGIGTILSDLSGMGYDAEWRNFYATQFGFNHRRKRTYGIAYARGHGFENNPHKGSILSQILQQQPPRQDIIPMPFKRFNARSDFECVQLHDGFSRGLDKDSITAFGNAIVPQVAFQIFKAIQLYHETNKVPQ